MPGTRSKNARRMTFPSFLPFFSSHPDCCKERSLWPRRPAFLSSGKSKEAFFLFPAGIAARISFPFLKENREIELKFLGIKSKVLRCLRMTFLFDVEDAAEMDFILTNW